MTPITPITPISRLLLLLPLYISYSFTTVSAASPPEMRQHERRDTGQGLPMLARSRASSDVSALVAILVSDYCTLLNSR